MPKPLPFFTLLILISCAGCTKTDEPITGVDFRQEMRQFVQDISRYSKAQKTGFIVIPQNGQELLTDTGDSSGTVQIAYVNSIDGVGREELFYGYDNNDDLPTPQDESQHWLQLCRLAHQNGLKVLTADYCTTLAKVQNSYQRNAQEGFISFAPPRRDLDAIPTTAPFRQNNHNTKRLDDAANFLYLINTSGYETKAQILTALGRTNYDVLLLDAFFQEGGKEKTWTAAEMAQLKRKANGGERLVIAYMSIGEAEDYRFYWNKAWKKDPPAWLEEENPQWPGNYKVKYWLPEWKAYITGDSASYNQKILDAGFDGVYLDIIDGFEYWEEK